MLIGIDQSKKLRKIIKNFAKSRFFNEFSPILTKISTLPSFVWLITKTQYFVEISMKKKGNFQPGVGTRWNKVILEAIESFKNLTNANPPQVLKTSQKHSNFVYLYLKLYPFGVEWDGYLKRLTNSIEGDNFLFNKTLLDCQIIWQCYLIIIWSYI